MYSTIVRRNPVGTASLFYRKLQLFYELGKGLVHSLIICTYPKIVMGVRIDKCQS